jgi:plastocyanin
MRFQLAVGLLVACALATAAVPARADDLAVDLAVNDAGFAPAEVKVPAGARVKLQVANQTGASIEFESFELNRERVVPPAQKVVVYLSGLSAGRYEFFDDFHQERRGVLVVE